MQIHIKLQNILEIALFSMLEGFNSVVMIKLMLRCIIFVALH